MGRSSGIPELDFRVRVDFCGLRRSLAAMASWRQAFALAFAVAARDAADTREVALSVSEGRLLVFKLAAKGQ